MAREPLVDLMSVPDVFDAGTCTAHTDGGFWSTLTVYHYLARTAAGAPERAAVVDTERLLTYGELLNLVDRLAAGLAAAGVGPGDRVSAQLPNWWEITVVEYALARLGAICTPFPPIYRRRELYVMLKLLAPKLVISPHTFRGHAYVPMYRELMEGLPGIEGHYVVRAPDGFEDAERFEELLAEVGAGVMLSTPDAVNANAISEIAFTSGTTGEPKGAIHTHNTNLSALRALVARLHLTSDEVILMASTFGHQTGFVYGGQLPMLLGSRLVLMDIWDADAAIDLIERQGVTWMMGATPFLQDLTEVARRRGRRPESLRIFVCSGAPVPQPLLIESRAVLGCAVLSGWGMSELGLVTLTEVDDPPERVTGTDGHALPGMAVRVVDEDDRELSPGAEGELQCRGHSVFGGYYRRPQATAENFTADGWFRTGDRATMDADGYIRIVGRNKDIVIRGGENIPVVEVENLLHEHPKVRNVAIVAMPDPRLQERACAFVVPRPGETFTFQEMIDFLAEHHLAKQYMPERLELTSALPVTPSGKVQKFVLRRIIVETLAREAAQGPEDAAADSRRGGR